MKDVKKKETGAESQKNLKDHDKGRKYMMLGCMAAAGVLECILAGVVSKQEVDRIVVLGFFGILYSVIFLAGMELYREQKDWFYERASDYKNIMGWHVGTCAASVLFIYLPEYARPVLLFSMGMAILAGSFFGMVEGMFHVAVFAICGQENLYLLLCGAFLLVGGCMAVSFLDGLKDKRWEIIFLFLYTFASVLIFSFLQTGQLDIYVLLYGGCNGVVSALVSCLLYRKMHIYLHVSRKQELEKVLRADFGLVQEVRNYSKADYNHARKVAEISKNCAQLVGADPDVAAAGGFYYRIGRMTGKPYVENGVALAKSNHLPKEIVGILREYNGEQKLPSTLESAIVHVVDSVVAKFDVLDKAMLSSSWNQDILVYQTLNENSVSGMYDKSGFSMNMFLQIRDYLIKEAKLF